MARGHGLRPASVRGQHARCGLVKTNAMASHPHDPVPNMKLERTAFSPAPCVPGGSLCVLEAAGVIVVSSTLDGALWMYSVDTGTPTALGAHGPRIALPHRLFNAGLCADTATGSTCILAIDAAAQEVVGLCLGNAEPLGQLEPLVEPYCVLGAHVLSHPRSVACDPGVIAVSEGFGRHWVTILDRASGDVLHRIGGGEMFWPGGLRLKGATGVVAEHHHHRVSVMNIKTGTVCAAVPHVAVHALPGDADLFAPTDVDWAPAGLGTSGANDMLVTNFAWDGLVLLGHFSGAAGTATTVSCPVLPQPTALAVLHVRREIVVRCADGLHVLKLVGWSDLRRVWITAVIAAGGAGFSSPPFHAAPGE